MKNVLVNIAEFNEINKNDEISTSEFEELLQKRRPVISDIVSNSFINYTNFAELTFLFEYIKSVCLNWFIYLENNDEFKDEKNLAEYMDIINSIISVTMRKYDDDNIFTALNAFTINFLHIFFTDVKFITYVIDGNSLPSDAKHNIVVEFILDNKISKQKAIELTNFLSSIFNYNIHANHFCNLIVIASDLWISDIDYCQLAVINPADKYSFDKDHYILNDKEFFDVRLNTFKNLEYTNIYENIKEYYKISDTINKEDDFVEDMSLMIDDKADEIEFQTNLWYTSIAPFLNKVIHLLYNYINDSTVIQANSLSNIDPTKDSKFLSVYEKIHKRYWCNKMDVNTINIYDDVKNIYGELTPITSVKEYVNNFLNNDIDINSDNVNKLKDGYIEWNTDCCKFDISKTVLDFSSYLKEFLSIYKNKNDNISTDIISNIVNAYKSKDFKCEDITAENNKILIKSFIKDLSFVFTISENDDKIDSIQVKQQN